MTTTTTTTTLKFSGKELLALAKSCGSPDRYQISHLMITPWELVTTNGHFLTVITPNGGFPLSAPSFLESTRLLDLRATDVCRIHADGIHATSKRGNTTVIPFTELEGDYPDISQVIPDLGSGEVAAYAGFGIDVLSSFFAVVTAFGVNAIKFNTPADQLTPATVQSRRESSVSKSGEGEPQVDIYGVIMPLRLDGDYLDFHRALADRKVEAEKSAAA